MRLRWWLFISIILAISSFAALYYVTSTMWPKPENLLAAPHLLFFSLMFVGLASATLPATAYLNYRFARPDWQTRDRTRLFRHSLWVGLLAVLLAYLQLIRALSLIVAVVLVIAFVLIEIFFLTRE